MAQLKGRVALITGGGSGVGLATAKLFLAEGAHVAIAGRDAEKLRKAAAELNGGALLLAQPCDVTVPAQVQALVEAATKKFGRIDILVNNAGMNIKNRAMRELTPETWRAMIAANLDGAFYCTAAVLPAMRQRKDGVIININSTSGNVPVRSAGRPTMRPNSDYRLLGFVSERKRKTTISACATFIPVRLTRRSWKTARRR